ncbi:MAG: DNA polymerase III subunit chi [Rhodospirillales bacterium]
MTDISFYHLQKWPLEDALPKLLEKVFASGMRAVIITGSTERVGDISARLWTYKADSWLPHGSQADGRPADQPVWVTAEDENPNGSDVLILTDGATSARTAGFARVLEMFDGNDPAALQTAREHWKTYRSEGHSVTYWKQTDRGGWEKAG